LFRKGGNRFDYGKKEKSVDGGSQPPAACNIEKTMITGTLKKWKCWMWRAIKNRFYDGRCKQHRVGAALSRPQHTKTLVTTITLKKGR
jgi:hypothetical protein